MPRTVTERADAVLALAATFRRHGFDASSLNVIAAETGLGRGSLYHFFPGGKDDMAAAVLEQVGDWFTSEVSAPLGEPGELGAQLDAMFEATASYFESRELVCLFAAFALGEERPAVAERVRGYFADWVDALAARLRRAGRAASEARELAIDTVAVIQGALVLGRALRDAGLFRRALERQRARL